MYQARLTESGRRNVIEFFDGILGAGQYREQSAEFDVLESIERAENAGESVSHEAGGKILYLHRGDDYTLSEVLE